MSTAAFLGDTASLQRKGPMNFSTFNKSAVSILAGVIVLSVLAAVQAENESVKSDLASERTQWMYEGKIGLATTYCAWKIEDVEKVANDFQVEKIAEQASQVGAKWFMLTIQHQPWLLLAPNMTYDEILGHSKYTPQRDVPMELYDALAKRGIRMMLYVTLRLDRRSYCNMVDPEIAKRMGGWPAEMSDRLFDNIAAVYREYSLRYGKKVSGWWIDGAWIDEIKHAKDREKWFGKIADALRAGNPDAAIAFNPGDDKWYRYTDQNDYLAGETNDLTYKPDEGRFKDGVQWHAWTHLGNRWASSGCRFDTAELIDYAKDVIAAGGALTFGVGSRGFVSPPKGVKADPLITDHFGYIDPLQVEQFRAVTEAVSTIDR